ncbi:hypothetical protein VT25_16530 [Photobacterium leiognathi subsp. mandapamensis]|nr:hypothetical protein VT25_16530 [Photobacterium leiognathi subsp. mandapamensis]
MNKIKKTSLAIACAFMSINVHANDIYAHLSDSEHFRTYPYIDRAYEEQANKQYAAALAEVDHALIIAPKHIPFLKFAYQLAVSAQKPVKTQLKYLSQIPKDQRGDDILNMWLQDAKKGKFYTNSQLKNIADTLTEKQMRSLFLDNLYNLNKHHGTTSALKWSEGKPLQYKSLAALRFEAYNLYAQKQYAKAQPILEALHHGSRSNETDLKFLALNTLANGHENKALSYGAKLTSVSDQQAFYGQYIEHLLATYQYSKAKVELNQLHAKDALPESLAKQRDYLNSLDKQSLNAFSAMTPCLKTTLTEIGENKKAQAIRQLKQCDPQTDSTMWIKLASELGLYHQIEAIDFKHASAKKLKTMVLLSHYKQQKAWSKVINLLHDDYHWESLSRELAYAYSQQRQYKKAAQILFRTYKIDHHNSDLNHAVFNALKLPNGDELAATMINYGLKTHKRKLLADPHVVQNIIDIALRKVELFSPQIIADANKIKVTLSPQVWQMQHQCQVLQEATATTDFLKQATAYCLADSDPLKAAQHYRASLTGQPTQQQALTLAQWFVKGEDYNTSAIYWHKAVRTNDDLKKLTPYSRYLYIQTLNETGQTKLANQRWLASDFDPHNEQWWQLGIEIAKNMGDQNLLISRIEQGADNTQSSVLTKDFARYIAKNNDKALAVRLFKQDKTGNASAFLGYQTYQEDPALAQRAFASAYQHPKYKKDVNMIAQYADIANKNGDTVLASQLYKAAIDQELTKPAPDKKLLTYLQSSHKNINLGWKYNVAGWIGTDQQQAMPGVSNSTGNYFLYGEAKYYFEHPWLPRSAVSIATLSNGGFADTSSDNTTDLDLSYQVQPIANHDTYLKAGVRQRIIGDDHKTRPYIRVSSNVLSNDKWSKEWKPDLNHWLYQNLYADGLLYLDNIHDYILFGRYEIGQTFKIKNDYQQRLTPYTFIQWADDSNNTSTVTGLGASWNWKSHNTKYDGLDVDSEVGLEWQHTLQSSQVNKSDDAVLLRFSFSF